MGKKRVIENLEETIKHQIEHIDLSRYSLIIIKVPEAASSEEFNDIIRIAESLDTPTDILIFPSQISIEKYTMDDLKNLKHYIDRILKTKLKNTKKKSKKK